MGDKQKTLDTLRLNLGNTPTEERKIKCIKCEKAGLEIWTKGETRSYKFLDQDRSIYVQPEKVYADFDRYCADCLKIVTAQREKALEGERISKKWDALVNAIGGLQIAKDFTFEKYDPITPSQKLAMEACRGFDPEQENLYLVGPAGVGKSHLACATAQTWFNFGKSIQRWRITELFRFFRRKRGADEEEKMISDIVNVGVLVIEDLGAHKETDWSTSILWEIIDRRLEHGINGLIVTTNLGRGDLAEQIGDRIPSRLSGLCKVVKIEGRDMRLGKREAQ